MSITNIDFLKPEGYQENEITTFNRFAKRYDAVISHKYNAVNDSIDYVFYYMATDKRWTHRIPFSEVDSVNDPTLLEKSICEMAIHALNSTDDWV